MTYDVLPPSVLLEFGDVFYCMVQFLAEGTALIVGVLMAEFYVSNFDDLLESELSLFAAYTLCR